MFIALMLIDSKLYSVCWRLSKYIQGKNATIKSSQVIVSKTLAPPRVRFFNLDKQVNYMVCLAKIVLYVVVFRVKSKFLKLVLERPRLLEEAMNLTSDFHFIFQLSRSHLFRAPSWLILPILQTQYVDKAG